MPAVHAQGNLPYTAYSSFGQVLVGSNARYPALIRVSDPGASGHRAYTGFFQIGNIRRLDPAADQLVPPNAAIEKVAGNLQFAEGPVWVRNGGYLLFSDIPANAIMK